MTDNANSRPRDAAEMDTFKDIDESLIMMVTPDRSTEPIGLAIFNDDPPNLANPSGILALSPEQAIELGEALVRSGIRKQVIHQLLDR